MQENPIVEPATDVDSRTPETVASSTENGIPEYPTKTLNKQIAVVSTLAAVGLFLSTRLDFGVSLKDLSAMALPYEEVCETYIDLFVDLSYAVILYLLQGLALEVALIPGLN